VPIDQIKLILTKVVQSGRLNDQEKQVMRTYITNLIEQDRQKQQPEQYPHQYQQQIYQ